MKLALIAALAGCALAALSHPACAAEAPRVEVPIKAVQLSDKVMRFTIPVTVAGTTLEAELDTGSSGLRLVPSALPDGAVKSSGRPSKEVYSGGVRLIGELADTPVTLGGLTATVPVEITRKVECVEEKPRCAASKSTSAAYRIAGDGLAGEGFLAIIGIGMRPADAANPVSHMGSGRWIVLLPRPGKADEGRLIINPTPAEMEGYTLYQLEPGRKADAADGPTWRDNQLPGCLVNLDAKTQTCAPTMLDTGAPGFKFAFNRDPLPPLGAGTHAAIAFPLDGDRKLTASFIVLSMPGTRVRYDRPTTEPFAEGLNAGFYPFYAFSVLYDAKAGKIGLKAR